MPQICFHVSLELKTYRTLHVFKGLGYKINHYLVCNLFIYYKMYIYIHTGTHM